MRGAKIITTLSFFCYNDGMQIKICSLNLQGTLNDWPKREQNLIQLFLEESPNIIILQEAVRDTSTSSLSQVEILNKKLSYPYSYFKQGFINTLSEKTPRQDFQIGYGIISRHPISNFEQTWLRQDLEDRHKRSILNFDMIADGVKIAFTNVHFSPKTNFAEAHLKETLSLTFKKIKKPIILGDFNLFSLEHFKKSYSDYYTASSEKYFYVSYPEQNTTLDYILLPKEYRFIGVSCPDVFVSDHRALFATVIIK